MLDNKKNILNEDLNKSFTHTRPKPDTNPPTERTQTQHQAPQSKDNKK